MSGLLSPRLLRSLLPPLSLAALLIAIFWLQPRTMSYFGLNLLLNLAIPIALATIELSSGVQGSTSTMPSAPYSGGSAGAAAMKALTPSL